MIATKAFGNKSAGAPTVPMTIARRDPGPHDILFDVIFCGICHTDITMSQGEFPNAMFPMVPGHEIIGRVTAVGDAVSRHAVGDVVGVGCLVNSCRHCPECDAGEEQFCDNGYTPTYNGTETDGTPTFGGYSERLTVDEHYAVRIPSSLPPASAAPLLCAGITTYSPLRHWKVGKGSKVGVVGLGGLGHLAVKFAAAMGADVTVFSTSEAKRPDAERLGASDFVVTRNPAALQVLAGQFDVILNTVSSTIDYDAFVALLKRDGTIILLGVPDAPVTVNAFGLLFKRRRVASSMIGGIRETQEMLEFCAEHGIGSDIEVIGIDAVDEAYERILSGDVRYRFVIDMSTVG